MFVTKFATKISTFSLFFNTFLNWHKIQKNYHFSWVRGH